MAELRARFAWSFTAAEALRKGTFSAVKMRSSADVCVIGGGVIGRCVALDLAERGVRVDLVSRDIPGASSRAAAGLLAPSIEGGSGSAHDFAVAARDAYPEFLERLRESVKARVEFSRAGILSVALDDESEQKLRAVAINTNSPWRSPNEVRELEPSLAPTRGGVLSELDGYVDNVALMDALEAATRAQKPRIREVDGLVSRLELTRDSATLVLSLGDRVSCAAAVLAAGAWSTSIQGVPRTLPLFPLKGQMIRYESADARSSVALGRPVYGAGVYVVSRGGSRILVGATSENAGFDISLTEEAALGLKNGVVQLLPQFAGVPPANQWSGIRPMTTDSLPVLGQDPDFPALIYACGHSRNGILKAPLTGTCVRQLFLGEPCDHDLSPFSPTPREPATVADLPGK
jgi:glycine oxidase ThiO